MVSNGYHPQREKLTGAGEALVQSFPGAFFNLPVPVL